MMKAVVTVKAADIRIVNRRAASGDTMPAGISRMAVRGFFASKWRSSHRLKAIAALRAVTMHTRTAASRTQIRYGSIAGTPPGKAARVKPTIAKGIAKMVCENLTRER